MGKSGDSVRSSKQDDNVVRMPLPADNTRVLASIQTMLSGRHGLLPYDPALLRSLWPVDLPAPPGNLAGAIETLLHRGLLRCVVVGRERHLMLAGGSPHPLAPSAAEAPEPTLLGTSMPVVHSQRTPARPDSQADTGHALAPGGTDMSPAAGSAPPSARTPDNEPEDSAYAEPPPGASADSERAFELQLLVDAETERVLLYRVSVVILALAGLTAMREWVMWLYHL